MELVIPPPKQKRDIKVESVRGRERSMSLPAVLHYNQEIAQHMKQRQYEQAVLAYERMIKHGVLPDVVTYNTMINVYVKTFDLHKALALFHKMKAEHIDPTIVTYTSLIDGCGKCNQFGFAVTLYNEFISLGIKPNMHLFNAVLNAGLLNDCQYIIEDTLKTVCDYGLKPNTVTFNTILNGFIRMGSLDKMIESITNMKNLKVEFSTVTQTTILQAVQLVTDSEELAKFIKLLETAAFQISKTQASQSVLDLIELKRLILAQGLIQYFSKQKIGIAENVYQALISLAGHFSNQKVLSSFPETPMSLGFDIYLAKLEVNAHLAQTTLLKRQNLTNLQLPNSTLLALIECFLAEGDDLWKTLANQLMEHDMTISEAEQFFELLSEKDLFGEIFVYFKAMKKKELNPRTFDLVLLATIEIKRQDEIIAFLHFMTPTPIALVDFIQSIDVDLAKRIDWGHLYSRITELPPPHIIPELMKAYSDKNMWDLVWKTFVFFSEMGVEASSDAVQLAFSALNLMIGFEDVMIVYNAARDANIQLTSEQLSFVMESLLKSGNYFDFFTVRDETEASGITVDMTPFDEYLRPLLVSFEPTQPLAMMQPLRSRKRSWTCPRMHIPRNFSDLDELSGDNHYYADETDFFV